VVWISTERPTGVTEASPTLGGRLLSWALAAGFTDIDASASAWLYATPESRRWWGHMWADRTHTAIADQAVGYGLATRADLERISAGWRSWSEAPDGLGRHPPR
jgi:hypothetical protein